MKRNPLHNLTKAILATTFALTALLLTPNVTKAEEVTMVQEVESNDTIETANVFKEGTILNGEISTEDDEDYFVVEVTKNVRFAFVPEKYLEKITFMVYTSDLQPKTIIENWNTPIFSGLIKPGTYYIQVRNATTDPVFNPEFVPKPYKIGIYAFDSEQEKTEEAEADEIDKTNISVTLSNTKYTYNGKAKKPKVIAKDAAGADISKDHYTVSYKNNTDPGIGKVTVTFDEEYNNLVIEKNITIKPAKVKIKNLKACYDAIGFTFDLNTDYLDGYQYTISTDANFKKGNKTYTKSMEIDPEASDYIKSPVWDTETELGVLSWNVKHGKTYYIRVRTYVNVNGKKIYSDWSSSKKIKVGGLKDTLPVLSYKWYDLALGDDSCIMFYVPIETYDPDDPFKDVKEHFWFEGGWFIPNENEMNAIVTSRAKAGTLGDEWAIYRKAETYKGSRSFGKGWNLNEH